MKKKNLIIIGKKSFIGSNIYSFLKKKKKLLILSFKDFMKLPNSIISEYDYVCNCSVNQKNVKNNYKKKFDFDLKIAEKIKKINTTFIFLSSRKVYKPKQNIFENNKLQPIDKDSKNKIISTAKAHILVDGKEIVCEGSGNGPVNALDNAIRTNVDKVGKYSRYLKDLKLVDYKVRILNTGTNATTRVSIESSDNDGKNWFTIGVSPNIIEASFKALIDSLDYKLYKDKAPANDN